MKLKKFLSLFCIITMVTSFISVMHVNAAVISIGESLSTITSDAEFKEKFDVKQGVYSGNKVVAEGKDSYGRYVVEFFGKKQLPEEYTFRGKYYGYQKGAYYLNYTDSSNYYKLDMAKGQMISMVNGTPTILATDMTVGDANILVTIEKIKKENGDAEFIIISNSNKYTVTDTNAAKPDGGVAGTRVDTTAAAADQSVFEWEYPELIVIGQGTTEFSATETGDYTLIGDTDNFTSTSAKNVKYKNPLAGNYEFAWENVSTIGNQTPYIRFNEDSLGNYYEIGLPKEGKPILYKYDIITKTKSEVQTLETTDTVTYNNNYVTVKQTENDGQITLDITFAVGLNNVGTTVTVTETDPVSTGGYTSVYMEWQNVSVKGFNIRHNDCVNPPETKTYTAKTTINEENGWGGLLTLSTGNIVTDNCIYQAQAFGTDYTLKTQLQKTYVQSDLRRVFEIAFNLSSKDYEGQRYVLQTSGVEIEDNKYNIKLSLLKYSYDKNGVLTETELATKILGAETDIVWATAGCIEEGIGQPYLMDITIDFSINAEGKADINADIEYSMATATDTSGTFTASISAEDADPIEAGYFAYGGKWTRGLTMKALSVEQAIQYGENYATITPQLNVSGIDAEIPVSTDAEITFNSPNGAWSGMAYTDIVLYENGAEEKAAVKVCDVVYDEATNNVTFKLDGLKNDVTYTIDVDTYDCYGEALNYDGTFTTLYSDSAYVENLKYSVSGNDLAYTFDIGNNEDAEEDVWVVVVAYDEDERMINVSEGTYTATALETSKAGTIVGAKSASKVKAFVLNGWATLKPYHKAVEGTQN